MKRTREIVVVGHFSRGAYLPEDPTCGAMQSDGSQLICLDPPPMRLRFHLSEALYGARPPSSFHVFTTSHYGLDQVEIGPEYPYLVLIETDGASYIVPRYQYRGFARDDRGRLALPSWPEGHLPTWLPCDTVESENDVRSWDQKRGFGSRWSSWTLAQATLSAPLARSWRFGGAMPTCGEASHSRRFEILSRELMARGFISSAMPGRVVG